MSSVDNVTTHKNGANLPRRPRKPNYNHVHRNLLPIEVHPLPPLIPHNPLSLLTIAVSYLSQLLASPRRPTYNGYFSSATSSVHVTDPETVRALWEMGFFGRGSLSRSEPTWQQGQAKVGSTAEENTDQRRTERRRLKRERARKEQQEMTEQLSKEVHTSTAFVSNTFKTNEGDFSGIEDVMDRRIESPEQELDRLDPLDHRPDQPSSLSPARKADEAVSDSSESAQSINHDTAETKSQIEEFEEWKRSVDATGLPTPPPTSTSSESSQTDLKPVRSNQKTKTVRFSPTIEAREFDLTSPVISPIKSPGSGQSAHKLMGTNNAVKSKEHLHLSLEEAFFLSYSLGVLDVYSDDSDALLPPVSMLSLFRRHSYRPPRSLSIPSEMHDPFMLSYAVYHHYRSLGWVVRSGIKFGVDYLLYNRGPAFSHADFAVMVMPSHMAEQTEMKASNEKARKSWWWLHGVNRVQAQVYKQLVLSYVEVPAQMSRTDRQSVTDIGHLFSRYKIRDVNVKRWTPNRVRD